MNVIPDLIKKRHIFFSLENALLPHFGESVPEKMVEVLDFLHGLSQNKLIHLYLISGLSEKKARAKIESLGLTKYFSDAKFFCVTSEYIGSKAEVDRKRHLESLKDDPHFIDHYIKQAIITNLVSSGKISAEESVLVGNDLLFDAFYTARFSKIDFVLVKEHLSMRSQPFTGQIAGLNYISIGKKDFVKVLHGELPKNNTAMLEKHIFDEMKKALVGDQIEKAVAAKKGGMQNN